MVLGVLSSEEGAEKTRVFMEAAHLADVPFLHTFNKDLVVGLNVGFPGIVVIRNVCVVSYIHEYH